MFLLAFIFALASLLCAALAMPLMQRRIKPNSLYGLRVPATFADEWVWYEANAKSGRDMLLLGLAEFALALTLPLVPNLSVAAYALSNAAFLGVGALAFAIIGWTRANLLLKQRRSATPAA